VTPLRIGGLELIGPSQATRIEVKEVQASTTLWKLLTQSTNLGAIDIHGAMIECALRPGMSSLEEDLQGFLGREKSPQSTMNRNANARGTVPQLQLQCSDMQLVLIDPSRERWTLGPLAGAVEVESVHGRMKASGNLSTEFGLPSSLRRTPGRFDAQWSLGTDTASEAEGWQAKIKAEQIPLEIARLLAMRMPEFSAQIPADLTGTLIGDVQVRGDTNGGPITLVASPLRIADVSGTDLRYSNLPWRIGNATVQGTGQWWQGKLRGDPLRIQSDFANAELRGVVAVDRFAGNLNERLTAFAGDVTSEIDIARLATSLPGLLPLREEARLSHGSARFVAKSANGPDGRPRLSVLAEMDQLAGTTFGKPLTIPSVVFDIAIRPTVGWPEAEKLELRSAFANASLTGVMERGEGQFDLDLERLSELLRPLVELPDLRLDGQARGAVRWELEGTSKWSLVGRAEGRRLEVQLPGGTSLREPTLDLTTSATGNWNGNQLSELSRAEVRLNNGGQQWEVELVQPIPNPNGMSLIPLRAHGEGQLASLRQSLGRWLPAEVGGAEGNFQADSELELQGTRLTIGTTHGKWIQAGLQYAGKWYRPETIEVSFLGRAQLPEMQVEFREVRVQSPAINIQGNGDQPWQFAFQTDFQKLGDLLGVTAVDEVKLAVRPVSTIAPSATTTWLNGQLTGKANVARGVNGEWLLGLDAELNDLTVLQLARAFSQPGTILPQSSSPSQILMHEQQVRATARVTADAKWENFVAESLRLKGTWLDMQVSGGARNQQHQQDARLTGEAEINTAMLAQRIEPLLGQRLLLEGSRRAPISLNMSQRGNQLLWNFETGLGWDRGQFASLDFGAAEVKLRANEQTAELAPVVIPVRTGKLNLAAQANYGSGPLSIILPPGMIAEDLMLDAELCRGWLKYIAPLAADATNVAGTFSLRLDETYYLPNQPQQSVIRGQVQVAGADLGPGPLTGQLFGLVDTIKAASRGAGGQSLGGSSGPQGTWLRLPPQNIEFQLRDGSVEHRDLQIESGNVRMGTSGRVGLDSSLQMIARIPMDDKWLGDDSVSQALIGKTLQIPISGTLAHPTLDSNAVGGLLSQVGVQAIEKAAGSLLNRALDSNRLNKSLEKGLEGLDKLFKSR
jgi:hypothetical protein